MSNTTLDYTAACEIIGSFHVPAKTNNTAVLNIANMTNIKYKIILKQK